MQKHVYKTNSIFYYLKNVSVFCIVLATNGVQACEDQSFNQNECESVGCCRWSDGECWSAVGTRECSISLCYGNSIFKQTFFGKIYRLKITEQHELKIRLKRKKVSHIKA